VWAVPPPPSPHRSTPPGHESGGYLSGSDTDSSSGDCSSTDVDTDDEGATALASAAVFRAAQAATPPAHYTARFTTRAELPPGATPFVLCAHACFGGSGAAVMSRARGGPGCRWEVCVSVPLETELTFWLGVLSDDDAVTEEGPGRTLRARRRGADVAVRCGWGSGGATRVQIAHRRITRGSGDGGGAHAVATAGPHAQGGAAVDGTAAAGAGR
jgi:hypothetical protein